MRNLSPGIRLAAAGAAAALALSAASASAQTACLPNSTVLCLDQGSAWTNSTRKSFYSKDQGSQVILLSWVKALKTPDGQPFLHDSLARYGYLPDTFRKDGLPVGFTTTPLSLKPYLGMTCAACHTRDITRDGFTYRVDGGPAITDFQGLLTDLIASVGRVLDDDAAFKSFADAVAGKWASASTRAALKADVELWYLRENTLRERAYGTPDIWGLGRLDAVSMIFDRLAGLDIGPPPSYLIPDNIEVADAPVRYPFLWNASKQDRTQWPGFSGNGTAVTALSRNAGEVFGVFATFHPVVDTNRIGNISFTKINSANWFGLLGLENLVKKIGPPQWPAQFPIIKGLVGRGEQLFDQNCAECHGQKPGKPGFPNIATWSTPIQDVGTDSRECHILARTSDPGVLKNLGSKLFPKFQVTNPVSTFELLEYSVLGAMVQSGAILPALAEDIWASRGSKRKPTSSEAKQALAKLEDSITSQCDIAANVFPYESRVMQGVWAAAPYLHNGSVPTLADLLEPSDKRPQTFAVGPSYDAVRLGMAKSQPGAYSRTTTGCEDRNSGNSRCGHEGPGFGTDLSSDDKKALLEFMKTL